MTFAHGLLIIGSLLALTGLRTPWPLRLALALAMVWAVPAAAVVYRYVETRRARRPLESLLLYQVYFLARLSALFWLISRLGQARQVGTGPAGDIARREAGNGGEEPDGAAAAADRTA